MLFPVLAVVNKSAVNRVTREDHIKQSWSCNAVYLAGLDSSVRLLRNYSLCSLAFYNVWIFGTGYSLL